ncbi:isochorismatase family protein [Granulicella cerasi]|uniref:Isochorismatase family protein n=1 Tax=Granulicella cerasi TaxID=741063 RepID=A0ABW1ZB52_9BACT|nr:isochorismatase family protein [Granulicella cerasi]
MPLTQLDPQTALLVVDLQEGLRQMPFVHPLADVLTCNGALLAAFRERGLPVVLINVVGSAPGRTEEPPRIREIPPNFATLMSELDVRPSDILITKRTWGAFTHTELESALRERGVTQVVVTGVATGTGVDATARQAYEAGFNVTLALDAITDRREFAHEYSVQHVFPRLGETGTTAEVLALLAKGEVKA